jgi:predicted RND superfamily exporter protein
MMLVVLLLTIVFGFFFVQLKVTMRWSDLLPSGDKRTIQFNNIIDEFTAATSLVVVAQGEEGRIKEFAEGLAPRILTAIDTSKNDSLQKEIDKINKKINKLKAKKNGESKIAKLQSEIKILQARMDKKLYQRVDYKTEIDFLRNNGLILIKENDLKNTKDVFMDPHITGLLFNINNSMEKEYVGQEESISTREKEDQAVAFLEGIQNLVLRLHKAARGEELPDEEVQQAADKFLFGEPYFLSYDKEALILNAIPNFSLMDTDLLVTGADAVQAIVDDLLKDYPDVKAGLTGMIAIGRDEMVYSMQSLGYTTVIAFIAILILLMISFRMWVAPIFAITNLLVGLVWGIGTAAIVVGQLNIMTQMMAVILLGLGIDFSIHIISGFTERRAAGDSIAEAMEKTFLKSGKGILTGALTTACAFLALVISHSRGMKEMGLVMGTGLLAILLATMLFLPSLLVFRERRIDKKRERKKGVKQIVQRDISFRFLGRISEWLSKRYIFTILASIVISFLLIFSASKISFDYNYMNIEPKGLTSIVLQDTVLDKFDLSMDYALVLTDNVKQSRELSKSYRDLGSVALTEDISLYLPSEEQQQKRIPLIAEIREKIQSTAIKQSVLRGDVTVLSSEIDRLQMNIMEIQDMAFLGGQDKVDNKCKEIVGDPEDPNSRDIILEFRQLLEENKPAVVRGLSKFQQNFAPYFKKSVIKMCSTESIHQDDLPLSILDRYSNKRRDQFLVTVFPAGNLWQDAELLKSFAGDLERESDKATGMPVVFRALIEIIGRDGRNAALLTLVIVFLLLLADFRNPGHSLIAMIPLGIGVFWMVGFMHLTGMQLTVMNVMGLPMIIGIGIDYGVHILHRWRHEGRGKIRIVYSSTGKAILLTSLTTMLAFGSLVFSIWRGFGQLGGALFLGVGACFLTTVIILPGIIGMLEKRNGKKS